ncbi:helix-turn-helix protein [Klugiella xanthotipulae]|uniref:Helix-turn-helix protein n=2 Tax=Klugiella xanthotipulae TaxID=244735 RepID=A0A543I6H7_9MICO|nr:helix-turn-helix protein [Klugiella xanthotipulae]
MSLFPSENPAIYAEEAAMVDAGEVIASALEASGLSKSELAAKLNVSKSEITARLEGERNITVRKLAATLHAMGFSLGLNATEPMPDPHRQAYMSWTS